MGYKSPTPNLERCQPHSNLEESKAQQTADAFQQKKSKAAVFIDLQQAYNHVWRAGLMFKMQKIGIQGNMYH